MMYFSQQEERLQMGQKPPTQLVSGLLLKAEKAGTVSQRMTKQQNNIQQTKEEGEKNKKKTCGIVIYSRLWQNCSLESFFLHHKPESLWWREEAFISKSGFL